MKNSKAATFCHIFFFFALLIKMFSLGFNYYPVLDDYIQYGGYPLYDNLSHVYLTIGTLAARPFASLIDPVLWGEFFPKMFIPLGIISALFFLGAFFTAKSFERMNIYVTPYMYAVLLLFPLGFEGTYWISASSRICVGIFFCGLSLYLLTEIIAKKRNTLFFLYIPTTLLSFGFYESVMILSALLQFFCVVLLVKDKKQIIRLLVTPVICGILMLLYYKSASSLGALGSRADGFELAGIKDKLLEFFFQMYEILIKGSISTTLLGAKQGLFILLGSVKGILTLILCVIVAVFCGYFGGKQRFFASAKICVPIGLLLVFLPLLPNILVKDVWLTYRSIVSCFIGLVLVSAPIFSKILNKRIISSLMIFAMVVVFSFANVNELDTYRRVHQQDDRLVTEIARQLEPSVLSGERSAVVVLDKEIIVPQKSYYKDHVKSVFDSDWALTGAVRAKCKNINIKLITPVLSTDNIHTENFQIIYIGGRYE